MNSGSTFVRILIGTGIVFLLTLVARWLIFRTIPPLLARHSPLWEDILEKRRVLQYLYLSVPGIIAAIVTQFSPDFHPTLSTVIYRVSVIYSIVMLMMTAVSAIYAYGDYYDQHYEFAKEVPIKPLIQSAVVLVIIFSILTIIAVSLGVSLLALAGVIVLIATILYYLFREPLLGFTASSQLFMNHMLGIGDWMEMERFGADGEVVDINVTSTKVRNWDNSIVNIPTNQLITNPFRNWQSMQSKEARRILRPIFIDQNSIAFVTEDQRESMLGLLAELYENLSGKVKQNEGLQGVTPADLQNRDQLTNLELYMAYATQIIAGHEQTRADYSIYVRQQEPSPQGLPVETFFFTRATDFVPYYAVQREIFSNLLAVLPQFELRPYQILDTSS